MHKHYLFLVKTGNRVNHTTSESKVLSFIVNYSVFKDRSHYSFKRVHKHIRLHLIRQLPKCFFFKNLFGL